MRVRRPSLHSNSNIQRITTIGPLTNTGRTQVEATVFARASTRRSFAASVARPTRGAPMFSRIDAFSA